MANKLINFLMLLLLVQIAAAISPSPSPSPEADADSLSPQIALPPAADSPSNSLSPANAPEHSSPPAPPPFAPSPQENGGESDTAPVPAPADAADMNHSGVNPDDDDGEASKLTSSDGGTSPGKKAGIAVGVILGAGLVGLGGFVYKRRQDNIRRSQYGYAARREIL